MKTVTQGWKTPQESDTELVALKELFLSTFRGFLHAVCYQFGPETMNKVVLVTGANR